MDIDDLVLVSVDDHVVEPPDVFEGHLAEKWRDVAPRMVRRDDGTDVWLYEGKEIVNIGLNAVAGRPPDEYGMEPTSLHEMRPGCYDIHERVRDMDANGLLGSMCFPSFPNLCGQLFARSKNKEAALPILKAYNDWHVEEWCGTYPGRFIPLMIPPIWDPQEMAAEVHRMAAKGCHAVSFSENPEKLKLPSFHSDHWDPFWQACSDEGTIVCLHIGSSSQLVITAQDAPIDVLITLQPMNIVQCAADLMWSRVIREFPDLRISLSEGGIGWIPYFLERAEQVLDKQRYWVQRGVQFMEHATTDVDLDAIDVRELFAGHVFGCFIDDAHGIASIDEIGEDNIMCETDYPHSDSTWPDCIGVVQRLIKDLPEPVQYKILRGNAERLYRFTPAAPPVPAHA